jgi:hypothetical protein
VLKSTVENAIRKGLANDWGKISFAHDDLLPLELLQACEYTLEINQLPLGYETICLACYHARIVGQSSSRFPLTLRTIKATENKQKTAYQGPCLFVGDGISAQVLCTAEWFLEAGFQLDAPSVELVRLRFSDLKYAIQAFPMVSAMLGYLGGPRYSPPSKWDIDWHASGSTIIDDLLPSEITNRLPAGVVVAVQRIELRINRLAENGFFKVQELWGNGVLKPQYGTKVPLNNWGQRGIPHCVTVSLDNQKLNVAELIGVFDIVEGMMASMNEDVHCTAALTKLKGSNLGFLQTLSIQVKQSADARKLIADIMNYLDDDRFFEHVRNGFLRSSQRNNRL